MAEERRSFEGRIEEGHGGGAYVAVSFDVREAYGTGGQVKVKASFDGEPYRGSIAPRGGGRHVLGISKAIRSSIGKDIGDSVKVVLERDTDPRTVETPADQAAVLKRAPTAQRAYERLSFTHRKEYVRWIEEAKKPETRARRLEKTIEMLTEGKGLPLTPRG